MAAAARGAIRRLATAVDSAASHPTSSVGAATAAAAPTKRWTREQVQRIYDAPLMELMFRAATVHRQYHDPSKIQLCTLLNIKCVSERLTSCDFA